MIINLPTPESLNDVALRLHFSAWAALTRMIADFEESFEPGINWAEEKKMYLAACQSELQSVCTFIQQSSELGLKAKICEVSPYLLLVNSAPKLSTIPKDINFSDLRSIDAVDLPGAVNTLCPIRLSDRHIQTYHDVRSLRNKISHLGSSDAYFEPPDLHRILVRQYIELWPNRLWLKDRLTFASQTRLAFFHDGRHVSSHQIVLDAWCHEAEFFKPSEFKSLFGIPKMERRYLCLKCVDAAMTKWADPDHDKWTTAYLNKEGNYLHCLMCGGSYRVSRRPCESGCGSDVISDEDNQYNGECHICRQHSSDY